MTTPDYTSEEWRPVVGAEGSYEVSSHGRVRSLPGYRRKGTFLSPGYTRGYPVVNVTTLVRKNMPVHILVCTAFHGEKPQGCEVLHKDGDRRNARAENLRWGTRAENIADAYAHGTNPHHGETSPFAKLTQQSVDEIRAALAAGNSAPSLANKYSVCADTIRNIQKRKTWFRT